MSFSEHLFPAQPGSPEFDFRTTRSPCCEFDCPFPLAHIDLHYGNVLVDEDFTITGIIDWSNAQTVPLEQFLISPEFAIFPGLPMERNAPILQFRKQFAAHLKALECQTHLSDI